MGIYNRDYYRSENASGGLPGLGASTMVQTLLIVTIAAFVLQMIITVPRRLSVDDLINYTQGEERLHLLELKRQGQTQELEEQARQHGVVGYDSLLEEWGDLDPIKVSRGQVWRLVTYAFLHSRYSIWHIVFNMLVLWSFGSAIEELIGRREFLAFYLAGAIFSGLCHVVFAFSTGSLVPAVGASGALMGVAMLFAIYYPTAPINVYFITIEARWLIILYLIYDALPILRAIGGDRESDGVAHAAHLGGLAFGFLYYRNHWRLTDWFPTRGGQTVGQRFAKWWNRPRMRVYQPPVERPVERPAASHRATNPRDLERRVDEILKKIKDEGEASLTDEERTILRDASQAYKRKNS